MTGVRYVWNGFEYAPKWTVKLRRRRRRRKAGRMRHLIARVLPLQPSERVQDA